MAPFTLLKTDENELLKANKQHYTHFFNAFHTVVLDKYKL